MRSAVATGRKPTRISADQRLQKLTAIGCNGMPSKRHETISGETTTSDPAALRRRSLLGVSANGEL
jgi:hypothetical protein